MYKVILGILIALSAAFSQFQHLEKRDVKNFYRAFEAIETAFKEKNFEGVQEFGPGLLKQYSPIKIQPDKNCIKARPNYFRLDSLVAYSVFRLQVESEIIAFMQMEETNLESKIRFGDNLLKRMKDLAIFNEFYPSWSKGELKKITHKLEETINQYLSKAGVESHKKLAFINDLNFKSTKTNNFQNDMDKVIEERFSIALSSNKVDELNSFKNEYPGKYTREINDRIVVLQADEVRMILESKDKEKLLGFINGNPDSPFKIEVLKVLEPILYNEAMQYNSQEALSLYLNKFGAESNRGRVISEMLYNLQNPLMADISDEKAEIGEISRYDNNREPGDFFVYQDKIYKYQNFDYMMENDLIYMIKKGFLKPYESGN